MWKEHTLLKIHHIYLIASHDQSRLSYENAIVSYASIWDIFYATNRRPV